MVKKPWWQITFFIFLQKGNLANRNSNIKGHCFGKTIYYAASGFEHKYLPFLNLQ